MCLWYVLEILSEGLGRPHAPWGTSSLIYQGNEVTMYLLHSGILGTNLCECTQTLMRFWNIRPHCYSSSYSNSLILLKLNSLTIGWSQRKVYVKYWNNKFPLPTHFSFVIIGIEFNFTHLGVCCTTELYTTTPEVFTLKYKQCSAFGTSFWMDFCTFSWYPKPTPSWWIPDY